MKWPNPPLLMVDTADALLSAAQMNVVEFHTWNSTLRRLDKPDRVIFDLDPGKGVKRSTVREQLADLKSGAQWSVQTAREYLSFQSQDPWADYWSSAQSLAAAIKRLR